MTVMAGRQAIMEIFRAEGVDHIFGNPGTTELGFMDMLQDYPDIRYIVCLHESIALGAAQMYANASGKTGVVNLHVAPGLGNALGALYNAAIGKMPLVVTAGQQDTRMVVREPVLSYDLVSMAKPLAKWSVQLQHVKEIPTIFHRAFKVASGSATRSGVYRLARQYYRRRSRSAARRPFRCVSQKPPRSGRRTGGSSPVGQSPTPSHYLRRRRTGGAGPSRTRPHGRTPRRQCLEYAHHWCPGLSQHASQLSRCPARGAQCYSSKPSAIPTWCWQLASISLTRCFTAKGPRCPRAVPSFTSTIHRGKLARIYQRTSVC